MLKEKYPGVNVRWEATSPEQLLSIMRTQHIGVPPRGDGRLSEHTERWTAFRLIATLAANYQLSFPITLEKRERPDFSLKIADSVVGLEISESVHEQFAKFCEIANREFPGAILDMGHFRPSSPILTVDQMRQILSCNRLTSPGWQGDDAEQDWATFISRSIDSKLQKLTKSGFKKFPLNWLSIYANLPVPHVDLSLAIHHLSKKISHIWNLNPTFDAVFIEYDQKIVRFECNHRSTFLLNDLWSNQRVEPNV